MAHNKPDFVHALRVLAAMYLNDICAMSATYPCIKPERKHRLHLFCLAPRRVCPPWRLHAIAVRSYRTFSPLPPCERMAVIFCGTFHERCARSPRVGARPLRGPIFVRSPDFPLTDDMPASDRLVCQIFQR